MLFPNRNQICTPSASPGDSTTVPRALAAAVVRHFHVVRIRSYLTTCQPARETESISNCPTQRLDTCSAGTLAPIRLSSIRPFSPSCNVSACEPLLFHPSARAFLVIIQIFSSIRKAGIRAGEKSCITLSNLPPSATRSASCLEEHLYDALAKPAPALDSRPFAVML